MSLHLDEDGTMEIVMRNIYTSCDPENSNLVPVRKIIDFITPYMLDNSSALESLRAALDPENNNVCISSEQFYEVMNDWTKKIAGSSEDANIDFNNTPNQLDVLDEKQLPYIQSTPRASFGQKLLSCEGLLNLSNVSTYSLSNSVRTKDSSTVGAEKTILEEEIKRLEHQLSKITNELINVKLQLTVTEEQNEVLQTDLDRCKTRLHSEQQIIEHLQNDKRYNDELREELNASKKQIEELSKKLLQSEKDNHHLYGLIEQTEKENTSLENRCEELSRREQDAKKEIIDIKTELDLKDQEVVTVLKINDELKLKLGQQKDLIDQLTNENELLNHNKDSLEKALKGNLSARRDSLVSQYKTCLADSCSFPSLDQSNEEECYFKIQEVDNKNFVCDSLQAEISQVSLEKSKSRCSLSPLDAADLRGDHKDNIAYYEQQINEFQLENAKIKSQLEIVNKENEELQAGITEMRTKTLTLEKDISTLMKEMQVKEDLLAKIKRDKNDTENEMKTLKKKNLELMDENSNLLDTNKAVGGTLEAKNKLLLQLDEKLLELKREVTSLHMENLSKEKELCEHRSKFNFEAAFKKLQMELNQKTKEVNDTENSNEELKEVLNTATRSNQELRQSLRQTKLQLKEYQEKSNQMSTLNENIENTASQVQLHLDRKNSMITELVELNKKFELNVNKLQQELQAKIKEVTDLRDCLKSDKEIRNIMWRDNKELTNINMKLTDELEDIKDKNKKIEIEYNMLLSKYNEETDNNKALMKQSERLSSVIAEHEEANKPLFEQVVTMRNEVDSIIVGQNEYKAGITKKLSKYEDLINKLETDLQEVKKQNDRLKEELETERIKTKRGILFDANVAPSESYKNRSFEKQKLSIDRLKEKLENVEVVLQNEKKKNEQLRAVVMEKEENIAKNIDIQCGLEQAQKKCLAEKQVLEGVVDELKGKVKSLEECYKKLEYASSEKETVLSSNLSLLEDHNKQLCNELTNKNLLFNNTVIENETYKNYIASMDKRLQEYSGNISTCMYQLGEKEEEIKRCLAEIAEKNEWNACLMSKVTALELQNKSLQETLSKSDDRKEKELIEVEQKLKNTCRLLQCSEMELSLIQKKICDAKEEFNLNKKEVANMKDVISSGLNELSRVSFLVFKKWKHDLAEESSNLDVDMITKEEFLEGEDNLVVLSSKIKVAVSLLEILANRSPKSMENTGSNTDSLISPDNSTSDGKTIQKFTLRPPRVYFSRPDSPDSPSVDINETNTPEIQQDYCSSTKEYVSWSADPRISQDVSCNINDSYHTAYEDSFRQAPFELISQDGFPNMSDAFLEELGLHESSPKQILSKEETERLFTTFAIQIVLDSKDIKERLQKQKEQCAEQYEKMLCAIKDVSLRLRDHKCIGATDSINATFVLLEDLKFLLKDVTQSIGRYGILTCENRMMKCWNLVTNYMALLKQETIKVELGQVAQTQCHVDDKTDKNTQRRRRRSIDESSGSREQKKCEKPLIPKCDTKESLPRRYGLVPRTRNVIAMVVFLGLSALILLVLVHWQCRITVPESQVCILDEFIKKIQVGNPPY